jgi:hypothetical protein
MATHHKFRCPACGEETRKSRLFDAVKTVAEDRKPACRRCGGSTDLHLSFDFALGVQDKNAEILASFYPHPPEDWCLVSGRRTVTFYPFLVVTNREGRDQAVWLPYWHVVQTGEKVNLKYGQWAPFMDMELFEDLLSQARNAGYLNHEA